MDLRERQDAAPPIRHPWERSRARAVERLLARAPLPPAPRLLDVGCGDAWLLNRLGRRLGASVLVGVDPALDEPTRRRLAAMHPPARTVPDLGSLSEGTFDVALLLDVLEHVEDDLDLLGQAASRLVSGGHLIITVPAHPELFSEHDRQLLHLRRYSRRALRDLVSRAGLRLLGHGALFASLLLPRGASLLVERLRARGRRLSGSPPRFSESFDLSPRQFGVGHWRGGPLVTGTILVALDLDNRLLSAMARVGLPAPGLSLFALCRTP